MFGIVVDWFTRPTWNEFLFEQRAAVAAFALYEGSAIARKKTEDECSALTTKLHFEESETRDLRIELANANTEIDRLAKEHNDFVEAVSFDVAELPFLRNDVVKLEARIKGLAVLNSTLNSNLQQVCDEKKQLKEELHTERNARQAEFCKLQFSEIENERLRGLLERWAAFHDDGSFVGWRDMANETHALLNPKTKE